jgi:hypothetical protein
MDIALTLLALIQGGALVHFWYTTRSLSASNTEIKSQLFTAQNAIIAISKSEPTERLTLLEQKVAAIQMKR